MDTNIAKKMILILLLLYLLNRLDASSDSSINLQAKSAVDLIYVDKRGGGGGHAGGHEGAAAGGGAQAAGGSGGNGGGVDGAAVIPAYAAGAHRTPESGRRGHNDGNLHAVSLPQLAFIILGLVVLLCFP